MSRFKRIGRSNQAHHELRGEYSDEKTGGEKKTNFFFFFPASQVRHKNRCLPDVRSAASAPTQASEFPLLAPNPPELDGGPATESFHHGNGSGGTRQRNQDSVDDETQLQSRCGGQDQVRGEKAENKTPMLTTIPNRC